MNVNTSQNDTGVVKGEFKSCRLALDAGTEILHTTALLPIKVCKLGKVIEVKSESGDWIPWVVMYVPDSTVTDPTDPRILIRSHRKATGDSMPRRA